MKKRLKFIDLFSGCGGFSKGFEMAGHKCLLGVDFDKDAIETFKNNHPKSKAFCGDIKNLTKKKIEEMIDPKSVDIIIGGPPCQGFSTVGKGDAKDQRNTLFKEFVRIVKLCDPKIIVMENVTGMLAKKNKKILDSVFRSFEKLGYEMDARVLAAEEHGVPERRRRTFIMGTKGCSTPEFPKVTHGARGTKTLSTVKDALKNLKAKDGKTYNHDVLFAQVKNGMDLKRLKHIPEGRGIRYQKDERELLPRSLWYGVDWKKIPENRFRQTKLQRIDLGRPGPTILTSRTSYYHPKEHRYLTAREAAACQSFPNDFKFSGSVTSQFRQIGNAVPPMLAKKIGETVRKVYESKKKSSSKKSKKKNYFKHAFHYNNHVAA